MGVAANPRTMKELIAYSELQKKLRADGHRRAVRTDGACGGLTDKEWFSIKHGQKSSFPKARKFTHHKMWRETGSKYTVEQLKQIAKS